MAGNLMTFGVWWGAQYSLYGLSFGVKADDLKDFGDKMKKMKIGGSLVAYGMMGDI
jgi:hypothetical protein